MIRNLIVLIMMMGIPLLLCDMINNFELIENNQFSTNYYNKVLKESSDKNNIITSPSSIYSLLGLMYFGAKGRTAYEISNALNLPPLNKTHLANNFQNMLKSNSLITTANKIYTNEGFEIKSEFNEIAQNTFESETETLHFLQIDNAIEIINNWIKKKTNNNIKNLIDNSILDSNTGMILINAIYFKGEWEFPMQLQSNWIFYNNEIDPVETDFLILKNKLKFSHLDDLEANAIELPYKNSDLHLMIILPNRNNNLDNLLKNIKLIDLNAISNRMFTYETNVKIPKFKIETKLELEGILKSMGMKTMFSNLAEFDFFESNESISISKVISQTTIDVNEFGTEAAAASGIGIRMISLNLLSEEKDFIADRPFLFAIKDDINIYFMGQLRNV